MFLITFRLSASNVVKTYFFLVLSTYTEFIKPGASMESRRFRTGQKNIH